MKEAEYMIKQALKGCAHYWRIYQEEKEHIENSKSAIKLKERETKELIDKLHLAVREFHDALGAELDSQPELSEVNKDIIKFLMQNAKTNKKPNLESGARADSKH